MTPTARPTRSLPPPSPRACGVRPALGRVLLVLLAALPGCAPTFPSFSGAARTNLGMVGLEMRAGEPAPEFRTLAKGALAGVGRGAGAWPLALMDAAGPANQGAILIVPLLPVAALVGAIYGGFAAEPTAAVEAAEATLQHAFDTYPLTITLAARTLAMAQAAGHPVRSAESLDAPPDAILAVTLTQRGLLGAWGVNPPLRAMLAVSAQLRRSGQEPETRELHWISREEHVFGEWAAEDAKLLRSALDDGVGRLSQQTIWLLFPPDKAAQQRSR